MVRGVKRIMKKKEEEKQLGVRVNVAQWRRFRALARREGRTAKYLLKEAIEEYIIRHGDEDK